MNHISTSNISITMFLLKQCELTQVYGFKTIQNKDDIYNNVRLILQVYCALSNGIKIRTAILLEITGI